MPSYFNLDGGVLMSWKVESGFKLLAKFTWPAKLSLCVNRMSCIGLCVIHGKDMSDSCGCLLLVVLFCELPLIQIWVCCVT